MNQLKFAKQILFLAIALTSANVCAQSLHEKSVRAVKYSLDVVNSKRIMEGLIEQNQEQSDATKQKMKSVVNQINFDELAERLSDGYQKQVTETDVDRCISFIDSPLGIKLNSAVTTSDFMRDPGTFFNALNANEGAAVDSYLSGTCLFINLPNKRELQDVFRNFLSENVCSTLYQTDKDTYAKLEHEGYCPR